mmetsp:Transcript_18968/g.39144  ORF Transcript_18968/g.39144 Transcript_18968/m.39144 type:complete len:118 (-) Transcript_18968:63-416(-)
MIPRRLHSETISSMLGMSWGLVASFSSVAEAAVSSVAADDKTWLAREEAAVKGRLPLNAKALTKFCPQSNIITEVAENFIGSIFYFVAVAIIFDRLFLPTPVAQSFRSALDKDRELE